MVTSPKFRYLAAANGIIPTHLPKTHNVMSINVLTSERLQEEVANIEVAVVKRVLHSGA
jgi:hypothetical protein